MRSKKKAKSKKSKENSWKKGEKKNNKSSEHKKSHSKRGGQEAVHKKMRVPSGQHREPFKSLMLFKKRPTITKDVTQAIGMKKGETKQKGFMRLDLLGDLMDSAAHKVGMPDPFSTTLFAPRVAPNQDVIYYLYKTYNFLDDLTKYDIYRRAAHYSALIPKRTQAYDEVNLAGMAVCASFDVKRRRELFRLRGRNRPEYDNYGRRMQESPRNLVAKMQKFGQPFFAHLLTSNKEEIIASTGNVVSDLMGRLKKNEKDMKGLLLKFMRRNKEWVKDRLIWKKTPLFLKFTRDKLYSNVVNHHPTMIYRRRGDQDLFNEFNFLSSHLAFSVHFCRALRSFRVNRVKEDALIQKVSSSSQLLRVRMTRYSHFPAVAVVKFNERDELQLTLPRIPKKAPSIGAVSGYSSDSAASVATDTPLDWELDWTFTDSVREHQMSFLGDTTRLTVRQAAEKYHRERRWKELERRRLLLLKEDSRFELQDAVPIIQELPKMHPPLIYCKLKSMELNKLRRSRRPEENGRVPTELGNATGYLIKKRIDFLEKTLPCKNDPRILLSEGWKTFATREGPDNFRNVAAILRQRSSWVSKNCLSRHSTVLRCDKLPVSNKMQTRVEGVNKTLFLVLIPVLTIALTLTTISMMSFT